MTKPESFIVGLFSVSFLVMVGALIYGARNPLVIGALYFWIAGFGGFAGIARSKKMKSYDSLPPRALFMFSFLPVFLTPFWFACGAIVYGWKEESPVIRYAGIASAFIVTVPLWLLFLHLAGMTGKTLNKAPEPTPGSVTPRAPESNSK
jgi:hypothetical protein